jgi:hypothetical protein
MNEPKVVQDKMNSKKEVNPKKGNRAMLVNGSQGSWAMGTSGKFFHKDIFVIQFNSWPSIELSDTNSCAPSELRFD